MRRWMQAGLVATATTAMFSGLVGGPADAGARGRTETYTSPTYGVSIEYDGRTWTQANEGLAEDNLGSDFVVLETDEVPSGLIIEVNDVFTDADECLDSVVELGLEGTEDAELIEDEDGEPIEGSSRGTSYAAYTFVANGMYYGGYFSCQEWGDEGGVISFSLYTASRDFDAAFALIEPILDSVDDSDARAAGDDEDDDRGDDDRDDEDSEVRTREAEVDEAVARVVDAVVSQSPINN